MSLAEGHASGSGPLAGANEHQAPFASGAHSISSSPSSVSIITPLMGPPGQGLNHQVQQQQSSMMKPIYVLGNPIGELDYSKSSSRELYPDSAKSAPDEQAAPQQANFLQTHSARSEKRADALDQPAQVFPNVTPSLLEPAPAGGANSTGYSGQQQAPDDRMTGPALVYSDGHLVGQQQQQQQQAGANSSASPSLAPSQPVAATTPSPTGADQPQPPFQHHHQQAQPAPSPRLFQAGGPQSAPPGALVLGNSPRRPSLPPPVNQANAASGFRSPMSPSGPLVGQPASQAGGQPAQQQSGPLQPPANSLTLAAPLNPTSGMPNFYQTSPPYAGASSQQFGGAQMSISKQPFVLPHAQHQPQLVQQSSAPIGTATPATSNSLASYQARRPLNITRVERKYTLQHPSCQRRAASQKLIRSGPRRPKL